MAECEVCARPRASKRAVIEGCVVEVCEGCASLGQEVKETVVKVKAALTPYDFEEIVEDFAELVAKARNAKGITREILAQQAREKIGIIERIENGKLTPDLELARRLEKILDISLVEQASVYNIPTKSSKERATLGDVVELK